MLRLDLGEVRRQPLGGAAGAGLQILGALEDAAVVVANRFEGESVAHARRLSPRLQRARTGGGACAGAERVMRLGTSCGGSAAAPRRASQLARQARSTASGDCATMACCSHVSRHSSSAFCALAAWTRSAGAGGGGGAAGSSHAATANTTAKSTRTHRLYHARMSDPTELAAPVAREYLAALPTRAVSPTAEAVARLAELRTPLPDGPTDPAAVLALLDEIGSPATMATAGGRFFGFVIGGALPAALAANWLAAAWDQNAGLYALSPIDRRARGVALALAARAARPAARTAAAPSSPARRWRTSPRSPPPATPCWRAPAGTSRRDGLFGAPPITVVVGDEAHPTLDQGARHARPRPRRASCACPSTAQGRMRADALPHARRARDRLRAGGQREHRRLRSRSRRSAPRRTTPARGSTSTARSACGPPPRRRARTSSRGVGRGRLVGHRRAQVAERSLRQRPRLRARRRGAARRDGGHAPPICRRRAQREPSHYTPELSRRARGVEIWAALRSLGRAGLAELIERNCRHAARFAEGLRAAGLRDAQRRRAQPGARRVRRRRDAPRA